jgi:hypothetical protein
MTLHVRTNSMGKSKFDTRPKTSNSTSTPRAFEYYTDADGKVHVREHMREGTHIKEHTRRKGLLSRFMAKPKTKEPPEPTNKSTSSREFMTDFDRRANALEQRLIQRSEENL